MTHGHLTSWPICRPAHAVEARQSRKEKTAPCHECGNSCPTTLAFQLHLRGVLRLMLPRRMTLTGQFSLRMKSNCMEAAGLASNGVLD